MRLVVFLCTVMMSLSFSFPAFAQSDVVQDIRKETKMTKEVSPVEASNTIKDARNTLSNDQKQNIRDYRTKRQTLKNMSPEDRKTYMEERRAQWNTLSNEEKEAKRTMMIERWSKLPPEVRERRKAKFNEMSEERRQAFKERHPRIYADLIADE